MLTRRLKGGQKPPALSTAGYVYASAARVYDFKLGAAPPGIIEFPSVAPTYSWGSYLSMTAVGNDPNNKPSYPIRLDAAFTGDWLFQASTRIDMDPNGSNYCSDAGIGLFNSPPSGTWEWWWGVRANRIAVQNNCKGPIIYGQSTSAGVFNSDELIFNGVWITMHMVHRPSINETRYQITQGIEDWDMTSPMIKDLSLADSFDGDYYCGIASDDDSDQMVFSALRAAPL
jgi:hypothetical protein